MGLGSVVLEVLHLVQDIAGELLLLQVARVAEILTS